MRLKRLLDRRAINSLAALGLLLGTVAPAALPAFASAAQLSSRSITMSTSATSATGVSYQVKFTAPTALTSGGGVEIDFCSNSAALGDTCTPPNSMDVDTSGTSLTLDGVDYNGSPAATNGSVASNAANNIQWTVGTATSAGDVLQLTFGGIKNPSDVGVFYARVTTYDTSAHLAGHTGATSVGTYSDEGSIALAATAGVGITSYVLESMSFCVSLGSEHGDTTAEPSVNCGSGETGCPATDGCVVDPSMTLGEETAAGSGIYALNSGSLSTGSIYAQLSSNASGNTIVNLKSDATACGGLYRNSDPDNCDIAPQATAASTFTAGTAKFGLKVGTSSPAPKADGSGGSGTGTFQIADASGYDGSNYFIDYDTGDGTGVTSTYGSPLLETDGPVDNMNIPVTFGASISNNTPAGTYGATFSLVAVGTF